MSSINEELKLELEIEENNNLKIIKEGEGYVIVKDNLLDISYKLSERYLANLDMEQDNSKLTKFKDRGFKFGDYLEVLIYYESVLTYDKSLTLDEFTIGEVKVRINRPSDTFRIVMRELVADKYYDAHDLWTISLSGITKDNYEQYLTQALFLLGYFDGSIEVDDYPQVMEFFGEEYYRYALDEEELENRRNSNEQYEWGEFGVLNHTEVLSFYNAGMELKQNEISFQYFYKVLEYFFLISRETEFKSFISDYNNDQDIKKFISKVTAVYRQNEDIQLKQLLNTLPLSNIIEETFNKGYIDSNTKEKFGQSLYSYRNRVVHGKKDEKFDVKTPSLLNNNEQSFWNSTVKDIAEMLIKKYCWN